MASVGPNISPMAFLFGSDAVWEARLVKWGVCEALWEKKREGGPDTHTHTRHPQTTSDPCFGCPCEVANRRVQGLALVYR